MTPLLKNSNKNVSFFHLNISSLFFRIEELSTLITEHNLNFAFLGITKSRSKLQRNRISSIQLSGYKIEYVAAKCSNGGTLLSMKKR